MKTKHTPAPWKHYNDSNTVNNRHEIVALGKTVARIYCTNGCEEEDAANGKLIARAPELLKALDDLSFYVFCNTFLTVHDHKLRDAHNNAFKILQELGYRG